MNIVNIVDTLYTGPLEWMLKCDLSSDKSKQLCTEYRKATALPSYQKVLAMAHKHGYVHIGQWLTRVGKEL